MEYVILVRSDPDDIGCLFYIQSSTQGCKTVLCDGNAGGTSASGDDADTLAPWSVLDRREANRTQRKTDVFNILTINPQIASRNEVRVVLLVFIILHSTVGTICSVEAGFERLLG